MIVIPITGAGLAMLLFLIPGVGGFLFKCFLGYLAIGCVLVWFCPSLRGEGKKRNNEW